MLEKEGIKATVIRKGKYKALGNPYEALSADARAKIEADMEVIYDVFTRSVADNRNLTQQFVLDNAAEGQVFLGRNALEVGLIDVLGSFDDAVQLLQGQHQDRPQQINHNLDEGDDMAKKKAVLTAKAQAALAAGADAATVLAGEEAAAEPVAAPASEANTAAEPAPAEPAPAEPAVVEPAEPAAAAAESVLATQLAANQDQLIDLKVQAKQAEAELATLKDVNGKLRTVVEMATQRLQIGTGSLVTELKGLDDQSLVAQFDALNTAFLKRFPVGAQAEAPEEEAATPGVSPLQKAQMEAAKTGS
jgi:hypothetical protein